MFESVSLSRYASMINRLSTHYIGKKLEKYKINYTQFIILMMLYRNEVHTQEEVRQKIYIDKAAVARAIKDLEDKGYVERISSEEDKRSKIILITEEGNRLKEIIYECAIEWDAYLTKNLNSEEKSKLKDQLDTAFREGKELFESTK